MRFVAIVHLNTVKWKAQHSVILILLFGMFWQLFSLEYYKEHNHIRGDGLAYYSYLPANFIYGDPSNRFYADLEAFEQQKYWLNEGKDGAYLPKMTLGLALLWSPGYTLAHVLAPVFGYERDGWSIPYRLSILLSGMLALILGAILTFKVLQHYFSDFIGGVSVLLLVFATHLLHYGVSEVSMSHVYTFALVAGFIHCFEGWRREGGLGNLTSLGFLLGMIVLIRPTNGIIAIYPLYFLLTGEVAWKRLLHAGTILAIIAASAPLLLQAAFWKITTGDWIYYSYTEESIYWLNPHIWEGLFSYRNGWLVYTPIFLLLIPGYWALRKVAPRFGQASLMVLVLHTYITLSWWCWYYGDSLSIRPMADLYPMFAISIAAGIWQVSRWKAGIALGTAIAVLLLTYNNVLFIKHYNTGKLTGSTMSKEAFWSLFLQPEAPSHLDLTLAYHQPDNERLRLGLDERSVPDTTIIEQFRLDIPSTRTMPVKPSKEYGKSINVNNINFNTAQDEYIRLKLAFDFESAEDHPHFVMDFKHGEQSLKYQALNIEDLNLPAGRTERYIYLTWRRTDPADVRLNCYPWNRSKAAGSITLLSVDKVHIAYPDVRVKQD